MAKNYKKIDWNDLKSTIPGKPDTWKVDTLGKFLKLCDLGGVIPKFKENAIDGNLFLTISEDDDEWDDLELPSKDEQALKHYQTELKKYNESFFNQFALGNNASQFKQIFDKKTIPVEIVQSQWYEEEVPKANSKKKKEEEKFFEEQEDEEATIKKIKKPKKPQPPVQEENESDEDKTIQRKQKTPKIVIIQYVKDKSDTFTFRKSFPIHRNKDKPLSDSIYINHKEISRSHAEVHYIPKSGYFLQDLKSSNHSYIRIPDDCNLTLYSGLELVMGESIITIEKIDAKKVFLSISLLFEREEEETIDLILEFPSNSSEIIFGRNPAKKKSAVSVCKLNSDVDKKIEPEHAKFIKGENNVTLKPLAKFFGVYIKLGDEEKASDLFLLRKDSEVKLGLGEVNFKVQEAYPEKIRAKCPPCLNNFISFIAFPCKHCFCSDCNSRKTNKKCKECGQDIQEVFRLIDISSD